jgi:DNA polymerase III delta subunit
MSEDSNIRGVIGDSMFFSMLEGDVISDLKEMPGFGIESTHRLRKDIPSPSPLGPPILPMSSRLVIIEDPSADAVRRSVAACERYSDLHIVLEWEDDTYDKRSKLIRDLVEEKRVVKMIGYIYGHDKQRFMKAAEMFCNEEGLDLSKEAIIALFYRVPRVKRATTVEKDGKKQRRDRLVMNLQRTRSEAIKSQCYAGIGNTVEASHVEDVVFGTEETDAWSLIDSICAGDVEMTIKNLDGCVSDIGTANEMIGLIRSQMMLLARVRGIVDSMSDPNVELGDVMSRLTISRTRYDAWEEDGEPKAASVPNWYRVQRILDLRGSPIWDRCDVAIEICVEAYRDMHGWLSTEWKSVMTRLCLRLCSPDCNTMMFPDVPPKH